ncbi:MAG: DinB family protein [Planctomycetota bacterium]|jgi:hypothetical protein
MLRNPERLEVQMLDTFKNVIANQFDAALCTLSTCIDGCPDDAWKATIANYEFNQVTFHTLIYADYYLGDGDETFRRQPFHLDNQGRFGDYEEFEDRVPVTLYERPFIQRYAAHCRSKATEVVAAETADSLSARSPFSWLPFTRAEVHVYNIRHIQHHAAQLILRLRRDHGQDMPWFKSGWPETAK